MTNTLATGIYTAVFESFSAINNSKFTHLNDEVLNTQVYGHGGFRIITFDHDYRTTLSKSIIQFYSDGQIGNITFQMRSYGTSYNDPDLNILFYSRVVAGKQSVAFNHALFDVDDVQLQNQILYFEDVNLNGNMVKELATPIDDKDAANKKYVDTEISNLHVNTSPLLPRDGSRKMTGNLDMDGNHILSVENITDYKEDDALEVRVKDLRSAVNKEYLNTKFLKKDKNDNDFDLK